MPPKPVEPSAKFFGKVQQVCQVPALGLAGAQAATASWVNQSRLRTVQSRY